MKAELKPCSMGRCCNETYVRELEQKLVEAEKDAELARSVYKDLTVHDLDAVRTLDSYKKCTIRLMREKAELEGIEE